jgi:high affinity Mn2+ porin
MFRTYVAASPFDLTRPTAAPQNRRAWPVGRGLKWTARGGQLTARWLRESGAATQRDILEQPALPVLALVAAPTAALVALAVSVVNAVTRAIGVTQRNFGRGCTTTNRSRARSLHGTLVIALILVVRGEAIRAQASPSGSSGASVPAQAPSTSGSDWAGWYLGARAGVSSGDSAWLATLPGGAANLSGVLHVFRPYNVFDESGSQFGGLAVGYMDMLPSRLVLGVEADVSFGAEPVVGAALFKDTPELFGSARGRIGYGASHWLYYATGGVAWTYEQLNRAGIGSGSAAALPDGTVEAAFATRIGWAVGAGIETPVAPNWTATAEYLYSHFGDTGVAFPLGAHVSSDLSMHQVRIGLNHTLAGRPKSDGPRWGIAPLDVDNWLVHGQTTYVSQFAPPFHAPYSGANSLASNAGRETWDATLYIGRRLWKGAELWINPEVDQGYGLSNTLGVAGFPSGEAYKVGFTHPYFRVPRMFVRQTFDLGDASEPVASGLNQFGGSQAANRVVVTVGRFGVTDLFDAITYAHDPRNDFMNWSLVDAGTFDYAADAWGFTYGAAVEWYQGQWTGRVGVFDLSIVPNSIELDHGFHQFQIDYELEHRHMLKGQPGKLAVVGLLGRGRMGRFDDAVALAQETGAPANTALVRHYTSRPSVNLNAEQQVLPNVGLFGRVGWADGDVESYEFTDIDRTASAGVSLGGNRWGRPGDTFGLATVVNGISNAHIAYLNAGGLGITVGDGQLPHPGPEEIVETYYRVPFRSWQATADYQFIVNPAYNRDRGPVSVISIRVRTEF